MDIAFTKMQGCGNDFVMVDAINQTLPADLPGLSTEVNDRRMGIGADGLILVLRGNKAAFRMRMFNPDGSEAEMCGNGIRCFAKFVREIGLTTEQRIQVETGAGLLALDVIEGSGDVRVDMGTARYLRSEIPMVGPASEPAVKFNIDAAGRSFSATAVSMGNPHCVIFVDDVASIPLPEWGRAIQTNALFPKGANVHFVQVISNAEARQRTWERGAGATLACGTGACASLVAGFLNGLLARKATMHLPGGDLLIEYEESGTVFMTGPAVAVFEGVWAA